MEDNIREWTGLEFVKSQRAMENRYKGRELVCAAPTTLVVKGWVRWVRCVQIRITTVHMNLW